MGKSLKNGISPDDIYAGYGADTLRLYEMATGPLDADRPWRTNDIVGVYRFLQRLWRNIIDEDSGAPRVHDQPPDDETARLLHRTVKVVGRDLQNLRFNTAIARLMELNSHAAKLAAAAGGLPRGLAEPLVLMVAPFAPHIAEELWSRMGHAASLAYGPTPPVRRVAGGRAGGHTTGSDRREDPLPSGGPGRRRGGTDRRSDGQSPRIRPPHRGRHGQPGGDRPWPDREHRDPAGPPAPQTVW